MNAKIKQNTDVINFEIERKKYRLGKSDRYVEIDTGDFNIIQRFEQANREITDYLDKLSKKYGINGIEDVGNISTGDISKDIEQLKETDEFLKNKIDCIFNYEVSKIVFGNASCVSVTSNGEYYFENFLNSVIPVLEKEFSTRIDKLSVRSKEYLAQKGKYSK